MAGSVDEEGVGADGVAAGAGPRVVGGVAPEVVVVAGHRGVGVAHVDPAAGPGDDGPAHRDGELAVVAGAGGDAVGRGAGDGGTPNRDLVPGGAAVDVEPTGGVAVEHRVVELEIGGFHPDPVASVVMGDHPVDRRRAAADLDPGAARRDLAAGEVHRARGLEGVAVDGMGDVGAGDLGGARLEELHALPVLGRLARRGRVEDHGLGRGAVDHQVAEDAQLGLGEGGVAAHVVGGGHLQGGPGPEGEGHPGLDGEVTEHLVGPGGGVEGEVAVEVTLEARGGHPVEGQGAHVAATGGVEARRGAAGDAQVVAREVDEEGLLRHAPTARRGPAPVGRLPPHQVVGGVHGGVGVGDVDAPAAVVGDDAVGEGEGQLAVVGGADRETVGGVVGHGGSGHRHLVAGGAAAQVETVAAVAVDQTLVEGEVRGVHPHPVRRAVLHRHLGGVEAPGVDEEALELGPGEDRALDPAPGRGLGVEGHVGVGDGHVVEEGAGGPGEQLHPAPVAGGGGGGVRLEVDAVGGGAVGDQGPEDPQLGEGLVVGDHHVAPVGEADHRPGGDGEGDAGLDGEVALDVVGPSGRGPGGVGVEVAGDEGRGGPVVGQGAQVGAVVGVLARGRHGGDAQVPAGLVDEEGVLGLAAGARGDAAPVGGVAPHQVVGGDDRGVGVAGVDPVAVAHHDVVGDREGELAVVGGVGREAVALVADDGGPGDLHRDAVHRAARVDAGGVVDDAAAVDRPRAAVEVEAVAAVVVDVQAAEGEPGAADEVRPVAGHPGDLGAGGGDAAAAADDPLPPVLQEPPVEGDGAPAEADGLVGVGEGGAGQGHRAPGEGHDAQVVGGRRGGGAGDQVHGARGGALGDQGARRAQLGEVRVRARSQGVARAELHRHARLDGEGHAAGDGDVAGEHVGRPGGGPGGVPGQVAGGDGGGGVGGGGRGADGGQGHREGGESTGHRGSSEHDVGGKRTPTYMIAPPPTMTGITRARRGRRVARPLDFPPARAVQGPPAGQSVSPPPPGRVRAPTIRTGGEDDRARGSRRRRRRLRGAGLRPGRRGPGPVHRGPRTPARPRGPGCAPPGSWSRRSPTPGTCRGRSPGASPGCASTRRAGRPWTSPARATGSTRPTPRR